MTPAEIAWAFRMASLLVASAVIGLSLLTMVLYRRVYLITRRALPLHVALVAAAHVMLVLGAAFDTLNNLRIGTPLGPVLFWRTSAYVLTFVGLWQLLTHERYVLRADTQRRREDRT